MTSHAPTIDVSNDQPPLPNQHFSSWLRGETTLFISQIVAVLGIISFLASMVYYVSYLGKEGKFLQPKYLRLIIDYAHIVFIAMFILVLFKMLDDNKRGSYRVKLVYERVFGKPFNENLKKSKEQLKNFKRRFLWFWIGMLVLYVVFACQHSYELAKSGPGETSTYHADTSFSSEGKDGSKESFEFKSDLSFPVTDKAQAQTSVPGTYGHDKPAPVLLGWREAAGQLAFPYFAFLFNNLTLWAIYLCFLVMHISRDETGEKYRRHRTLSLYVLVGFSLTLPVLVYGMSGKLTDVQWTDYSSIFDALSGVINAIVLALLIARLDSKLVGLPSWLISILYSYAAVQPLFLVFELKQTEVLEAVAVFVLFFVFISKIYFFLIIIYALQTGKMLNYLFCVNTLRERAEASAPSREQRASTSVRLRDDWRLNISKALGLTAAAYFFLSLIVPGILPEGGTTSNVFTGWGSYILLKFLRPPDWAIDCLQLAAIMAIIMTLWRARRRNHYDAKRVTDMARGIFGDVPKHADSTKEGEEQLRKFKKYFLCFWCVTLGLYIVFLLRHLDVRVCFDSTSYVGFGFTRKVLWLEPHCNDKYPLISLALAGRVLSYPFLEFSLATLNIMFIYWCFVVLHTPAFGERAAVRQRLMFNYSRFIILLLIAVFPLLFFLIGGPKMLENEMRGYATVFDGVTGGLSAIALALLIARMDAALFGLPRWTIPTMFAYASIQPLFIAFALKVEVLNLVQTSTLVAAFLLKICFFLIVAHCLQSGKVINYLVCFPFLRDRVDSIFENQFEIGLARAEHNLYTFSITKKNKSYYSTVMRFENRGACDEYVNYLRALMEEKDAYWVPKPASGTYWVEVRALRGDLICESGPLRSEEEAAEMISESREKIPYCKYNRT